MSSSSSLFLKDYAGLAIIIWEHRNHVNYYLFSRRVHLVSQSIHIKVCVKSKLTIFILLAQIAIFVVNNSFIQVNTQKTIFAFIIVNLNLKMLLASKMMGLLWWHQFDGLGISVTSLYHAPPTVSVYLEMKRLLYYIQSIRSRKN